MDIFQRAESRPGLRALSLPSAQKHQQQPMRFGYSGVPTRLLEEAETVTTSRDDTTTTSTSTTTTTTTGNSKIDQAVPAGRETDLDGSSSTSNSPPAVSPTLDATDPASQRSDEHMSVQSLLFSIGIVLVLFWCARPRNSNSRAAAAARRRREQQQQWDREHKEKKQQKREERVNKSLLFQKVLKREGQQLTLGPEDALLEEGGNEDNGSTNSQSTGGDETSVCVICLEPFQVGDVLALSRWTQSPCTSATPTVPTINETFSDEETGEAPGSPAESTNISGDDALVSPTDASEQHIICNHVFHRDCIQSWLSNPKHDDCPACRATIVRDVDGMDDLDLGIKPSVSEDSEDVDDSGEEGGLSSMAFVVMNGLVSQVRRASYSLIGTSVNVGDDDDHEHAQDDTGMEMVVPSASAAPANILPLASPLRRVFSHGDRRPSPILRRRSFGQIKTLDDNVVSAGRGGVVPAFPMRRTLSAGTVVSRPRRSSDSSLQLSADAAAAAATVRPLINDQYSSAPSSQPVWTIAAERALSQALDDRSLAGSSPLATSRRLVSPPMESPGGSPSSNRRRLVPLDSPGSAGGRRRRGTSSSPRGFRKTFGKDALGGGGSSSGGGLPPLPLPPIPKSRFGRQKSGGYALVVDEPSTQEQHNGEMV